MSQQHDASNSGKSGAVGPVTVALASVGAALAPAAEAATFTVTNTNDSGAGSLRQAIEDANADTAADTIVFQAGVTGTITLTTGQLEITESVTITGPGAANLTVSGNNASRVFYMYNGSTDIAVEISGLTIANGYANIGAGLVNFYADLVLDSVVIRDNTATNDGGGLWMDGFTVDATIRNSQITGNTAGDDGGGIYVEDTGGPLLIEDSVISGNTAAQDGGGIYFYDPDDSITIARTTISGNTAEGNLGRAPGGTAAYGSGGGIYTYDTDGGTVTMADSTLSGNTAGRGGGAYFYGPDDPVDIVGSTVSGNTAQSGDGGGLNFYNLYSVNVRHSTIVDNAANGEGGGIYAYEGIGIDHSIVANNTSSDGADLATGDGTIDLSFSLVENVGAASINDNGGNQFAVDPMLGPLQFNGGTTETHLPAAGSPVIDAGDPGFTGPPNTDQAGNPRIVNGVVDVGALEVQAAVAPLVPQVPVPALGLLGMAAAALGVGGIGAAAARKRRLGGKAGALMLALASVSGFHATEASAADRGPATTRIVTTVTQVSADGQSVSLDLGNGQRIAAAAGTLEVKDRRRHVAQRVESANAIAAGQPVLIKIRHGRDGQVKRTVVRLVDSIEAAQREVAGK